MLGECECAKLGGEVPVAADDAPEQAAMSEVVQAALGPVSLAGAVVEGEICGGAGLEEAALQGGGEQFRMTGTDEAAHGDGGAAGDGGDGFVCCG